MNLDLDAKRNALVGGTEGSTLEQNPDIMTQGVLFCFGVGGGGPGLGLPSGARWWVVGKEAPLSMHLLFWKRGCRLAACLLALPLDSLPSGLLQAAQLRLPRPVMPDLLYVKGFSAPGAFSCSIVSLPPCCRWCWGIPRLRAHRSAALLQALRRFAAIFLSSLLQVALGLAVDLILMCFETHMAVTGKPTYIIRGGGRAAGRGIGAEHSSGGAAKRGV